MVSICSSDMRWTVEDIGRLRAAAGLFEQPLRGKV
jgi:hypothetical protein